MRCKWCGNPESIRKKPEISYDPNKCTGKKCGICLKAPFPEGAFYFVEGDDSKVKVNWQLASDCDNSHASLCPTGALEMFGKTMTVGEVMDEVEKDSLYLPQYRWRYDNQWWRSNASARLCCSLAAGSPQQGY